jgi:hypothetical protein
MMQAGFDEVHGNSWFAHARNRNHWGVDDTTLFDGGLDLIRRLETGDRPWFLTLLTVGTHHRYNVPPDFEGHAEPGSAAWAFEYLDLAVGRFIAELDGLGIRNDTLVLITSDESQAMKVGAPDVANALTQGWGFLIALVPSGEHGQVGGLFTQPDVPLSILDYLGIDVSHSRFGGRSVFRQYDRPRQVFWGNTHLGLVAGLSEENAITVCTETFTTCDTFSVEPTALFSPHFDPHPAEQHDIEWLRAAAATSLIVGPDERRARSFELIPPGPESVLSTGGEQYVFGGQFWTVPGHTRLDLQIEVELLGEDGSVRFAINMIEERRPLQVWSDRLRVGETLTLEATLGTDRPIADLECRFWVTASQGDDLTLDFRTARLVITPLDETEPTPPTEVEAYRIEP